MRNSARLADSSNQCATSWNSPDKSPWTELSDYLKGIRPTLPAWTPQIDHKGRFHARKMLEKIGIADYNERKDPILELANRMAKAYDLLRMELYAGGSWDSAYERPAHRTSICWTNIGGVVS